MADPATTNADEQASELPEKYRMSEGERPERIRRRNLMTGLGLLVLIATIVAITVYSRATSEDTPYGVERDARPMSPPQQPGKSKPPQH